MQRLQKWKCKQCKCKQGKCSNTVHSGNLSVGTDTVKHKKGKGRTKVMWKL